MNRHLWLVLSLVSSITLPCTVLAQTAQTAGLKIVVLAGDASLNIIPQKTAVAPVVEVRDRNDHPVAGAIVRFTVRAGRNARLNAGLRSLQVTTDAAGRAAVSAVTPTGTGAVQIDIAASFQGQTATATIAQTNFATAAQAANAANAGTAGSTGSAGGAGGAGSAGGTGAGAGAGAGTAGTATAAAGAAAGGGGISGLTIAGIAGAAVGGSVGAVAALGSNAALAINAVTATPPLGLQSASPIQFSTEIGNPDHSDLSYSWTFGDGSTATGATPTHLYDTAGLFTIKVTVDDGQGHQVTGQTAVTIKSLTGRWPCFTCNIATMFYTLTQTGKSITGTFPIGGTTAAVTGSVQTASPMVTFGYPAPAGPAGDFIFTGNPGADGETLIGTAAFPNNPSATVVNATSTRLP